MENPRKKKSSSMSARSRPRRRSSKPATGEDNNGGPSPRKGSVEMLKAAGRVSGKLSPLSWQKNSKSVQLLRKRRDSNPDIHEYYKSDKICCWELTNIANAEKFEKHWQDCHYDFNIPIPKRLKFARKRYLYFHDVYYSQLFEVYDTGSRVYLMRWAGPNPLYTVDGGNNCMSPEPFMMLWDEFVCRFEPGKFKRVFIHPEENDMREFLEKTRYAELIESDNDYTYEKWYIHNPEEYSSS